MGRISHGNSSKGLQSTGTDMRMIVVLVTVAKLVRGSPSSPHHRLQGQPSLFLRRSSAFWELAVGHVKGLGQTQTYRHALFPTEQNAGSLSL